MLGLHSPLLLMLFLAPSAGAQEGEPHRLTGVWEGRGSGKTDLVPPEGFGFVLVLEGRGEDKALASLTMEGVPTVEPAEAEFDADTGELVFRCNLQGIQVDVELVVDGETITGTAGGLGVKVDLEGRRTSRTLPEPQAQAPQEVANLESLTTGDWRSDLAFLAETLPAKHVNAFHRLPAEDWARAVTELDARLEGLAPATIVAELARLVARLGDAHTFLALQGEPFARALPVRFEWLEDGLFVTHIDERWAPALGLRVTRFGNRGTADALAQVRSLIPSENTSWPRYRIPRYLPLGAGLQAVGLIEDAGRLPLTLEGAAGEPVEIVVELQGRGTWLRAPDPRRDPVPLWRQRTGEAYWFQTLESGAGVYWAYNRCAEDPVRPMNGFVDEVLATLEGCAVRRLVIDLRNNSGGNSAVLATVLPRVRAALGETGVLWALIGPVTFSSGMRNAIELQGIGARLAGEPTGGKPNAFGEVRLLVLPRSGLKMQYSTKRFVQVEGDPPSVEPDLLVPLGSEDFLAGRDPVLERVLNEE